MTQFSTERRKAVRRCIQFVAEGIGKESIWRDLNCQIYLGDTQFVERMQVKRVGFSKTVGVPKTQTCPYAPPLEELASRYPNRNKGIVAAYATGEYSYQQIADFYGLNFTTIGKILRKARISR